MRFGDVPKVTRQAVVGPGPGQAVGLQHQALQGLPARAEAAFAAVGGPYPALCAWTERDSRPLGPGWGARRSASSSLPSLCHSLPWLLSPASSPFLSGCVLRARSSVVLQRAVRPSLCPDTPKCVMQAGGALGAGEGGLWVGAVRQDLGSRPEGHCCSSEELGFPSLEPPGEERSHCSEPSGVSGSPQPFQTSPAVLSEGEGWGFPPVPACVWRPGRPSRVIAGPCPCFICRDELQTLCGERGPNGRKPLPRLLEPVPGSAWTGLVTGRARMPGLTPPRFWQLLPVPTLGWEEP